MNWDIVHTINDLEIYVLSLKNDFNNNKNEWENDNIEACLEAAMACLYSIEDRSGKLNRLYDNLDIKELKFAAILLLSAAFQLPVNFITSNIKENDFSINLPKGTAFAMVFNNKWKIIYETGFHIEESMDCFFDKVIYLLKDRNVSTNKDINIQIRPNILTFIACVLDLGKYYE